MSVDAIVSGDPLSVFRIEVGPINLPLQRCVPLKVRCQDHAVVVDVDPEVVFEHPERFLAQRAPSDCAPDVWEGRRR